VISAEFVACENLASGSLIDIETKSRRYRIEWLGGFAIRISGHPQYCPNPVQAQLQGSIDEEGAFEFGVIGRDRRLVFLLGQHRPITTSRVVRVRVDPPKTTETLPLPVIN
jgi:hypothetical protein